MEDIRIEAVFEDDMSRRLRFFLEAGDDRASLQLAFSDSMVYSLEAKPDIDDIQDYEFHSMYSLSMIFSGVDPAQNLPDLPNFLNIEIGPHHLYFGMTRSGRMCIRAYLKYDNGIELFVGFKLKK